MPRHDIEEWERQRAEIEIRHWLITQHLWAPEALYQQLATQEVPEQPINELDNSQIDHLLQTEVVGRIGCHVDGRTYVVPITYVYDGENIYGHTIEGTKTRMMRANPKVCFEVDHVDGLTKWQSVIVQGQFEELHGADADYAMRLLIDRIKPQITGMHLPPHGFEQAEMLNATARARKVVVYRIKLIERTGRFQKR